jgi:glycosyltransferase involved in cell wall biosynthesis
MWMNEDYMLRPGTMLKLRAAARRVMRFVAPLGSRRRRVYGLARNWIWRKFAPHLADPFDRAALAKYLVKARTELPFDDTSPITAATAAKRVLALLVTRPDLRERFPNALRETASGPFGAWVNSAESGFTADERAHVLAVLDRTPSARVIHWFDHSPNMYNGFPLALTPSGASRFAWWLLRGRHGANFGATDDDVLWFLFERATDPACGLAATYVRNPVWQRRVPDGLTPAGWDALRAWVRRTYRVRGSWIDAAARPDDAHEEPGPRGVNMLGHFRYPSGLQVAAANVVAALDLAGWRTSLRDVPTQAPNDLVGRDGYLGLHPYPVTISQLPPEPFAADCYPYSGLDMRPSYRIGYWYWEAEHVPAHWKRHARWLNELWAPTRFIGSVLRSGMKLPVVDMLAGMRMPPVVTLPRAHFGLPDNKFLFLFVFDMCSSAQRKNPFAVVEAYRRAFRNTESVALAIKVSRGTHDKRALARLRAECGAAGAHLIDSTLDHSEVFGLINCCDAYVSLHRSEGYGLTMAEAMALGKPVVATGYSGNLDFMTADNSLLVDHTRGQVQESGPVYKRGWTWAEPSVEHAAAHMRRLYENPELGRALGARARADVRRTLSLEAAGRRMAARLDELAGAPPVAARRAA